MRYYWKAKHQSIDAAVVPGTQEVIRTGATEQTFEQWQARCKQLGIHLDNPYATFGDCACQALPVAMRDRNCAFLDESAPELLRRPRISYLDDVMRFIGTAASWFRSDQVVPQEQAEARAQVCRMCPHNSEPLAGGCPSCTGAAQKAVEAVFKLIDGRTTTQDSFLKACDRCNCAIPVMVWTPLESLLKHQEGVQPLPPWCWKVTEG